MRRLLWLASRLDCAHLVRHLALCIGAAAAFAYPGLLRAGNLFLGLVALAAVLNFLIALLSDHAGFLKAARVFSSGFGISGWAALAWVTGGTSSPFIAGFWLEIILSALTFTGWGTPGMTAACMAALWGQQAIIGLPESLRSLVLQSGFLLAMGLVTLLLTRQWQRARSDWQHHQQVLAERLSALESEIQGVRESGELGENTARLAHSIKNAVHAMRGFTALIQQRLDAPDRNCRAVEGLQTAVDRLEDIVRLTLGRPAPIRQGQFDQEGAAARPVIEDVIAEVKASHPGIRWKLCLEEPLPSVSAPGVVLHEALIDLAHNAAEAMDGRGEITLLARPVGENLEIEVRDHGKGISHVDIQRLFLPGFTTKPRGSGFGLFLARRLLESYGGSLRAGPPRPDGAAFLIGLPLVRH